MTLCARNEILFLQLRDKEYYDFYTGAMQRAEVVFFMRLEEENRAKL